MEETMTSLNNVKALDDVERVLLFVQCQVLRHFSLTDRPSNEFILI